MWLNYETTKHPFERFRCCLLWWWFYPIRNPLIGGGCLSFVISFPCMFKEKNSAFFIVRKRNRVFTHVVSLCVLMSSIFFAFLFYIFFTFTLSRRLVFIRSSIFFKHNIFPVPSFKKFWLVVSSLFISFFSYYVCLILVNPNVMGKKLKEMKFKQK